ncbi:MAG: hypothetical protein NZT92_15735 [Abditibacteriales bacterium]|nr:hypothetical protein [Abditibacteriales bacterium]
MPTRARAMSTLSSGSTHQTSAQKRRNSQSTHLERCAAAGGIRSAWSIARISCKAARTLRF